MRRQRIIRIQIFALFTLAILLVGRALMGPPSPDGLLVLSDMDEGELLHSAFSISQNTSIHIRATGSSVGEVALDPLAAYGWILDRRSREAVWRMGSENIQRESGTLVHAETDIDLVPGVYDVYFTTYGPTPSSRKGMSFLGLRHHWKNDSDTWSLSLQPAPGASVQVISDEPDQMLAPGGSAVFSSAAPMTSAMRKREILFKVSRPVSLNIYAVGELCESGPCDFGWIEDVSTGLRVWEMTGQNTRPAGGWSANRQFRGDILFQTGIFRATFEIDRGHAFGDWRANPPFDPAAWGLTLSGSDLSSVSEFDPWTQRTPLVSLIRITNDELRSAQFAVREPTRFIVSGLGEISSGGNLYDYGWIENNATGERVWEMSREQSQPARGENKGSNRVETDFILLPAGTYTLSYQTDGSHAFGDWKNGKPEHSERWGVTLFPFEDSVSTSTFVLLGAPGPPLADIPTAPSPPPASLGEGDRIVERIRIGNDQLVSDPLILSRPTRLHIYALGEISRSGRYDYGWIERAETGETVWKMTLQNTQQAGGDDRNRVFDNVISLPKGSYVVYFKSDYSHAFNDFDSDGPDDPIHWGITVERLPK